MEKENLIKNKKDIILGTSIGDIVGSKFEINNCKTGKKFVLFDKYCRFTDDTVMTFSVAKSLLEYKTNDEFKTTVINNMVEIGRKYHNCGYGPSFYRWIKGDSHEPYNSYGNGAAMRVSSIPCYFKNTDDIKKVSKIVTDVSHNNDESVLGAEIVCMTIYYALKGLNKEEILNLIESNYFKIKTTLKELQESKKKVVIRCLDTVKVCLVCFFESNNYEDAIRNAISIGGDSDTIAAITGGIAASYYGIPNDIYEKGISYLPDDLKQIHDEFEKEYEKIWNH